MIGIGKWQGEINVQILRFKGDVFIDIADDVNTYCWSTDDILYRVFHVRTTRNRAFESDAINFYKLITEGKKNSQEAKMLYSRLSKFVLPGDDPLLKLIKMGE